MASTKRQRDLLMVLCAAMVICASARQQQQQQQQQQPQDEVSAARAVQTTQAGCKCLPGWRDAAGEQQNGCANPTSDPKGAWCAVDADACPGYYGLFRGLGGAEIAFDYCGDVRERTVSGCLCEPAWRLDGVGKDAYQDRCASPSSQTERKCRVAAATCPPGRGPSGGGGSGGGGAYDACHAQPSRWGAPAVLRTRTYHNCTCLEGGWWWLYPEGTGGGAAPGPVNRTVHGCGNPDGDPLGTWCAVDSRRCAAAAGRVAVGAGTVWTYDYCERAGPPASSPRAVGGAADGTAVVENSNAPPPLRAGLLRGGDAGAGTGAGATLLLPELGEAAQSAAADAAAPGSSALPPPPARKAPGAAVNVELVVGYPYALVAGDPGAQARLKSDLVAWLKGAAGPAEYVHSAGVDALSAGSTGGDGGDGSSSSSSGGGGGSSNGAGGTIIVSAHAVFTADAPAELVAAAPAALRDGAAALYRASALPSAWGPLVGAANATLAPPPPPIPEEQSAVAVATGSGGGGAGVDASGVNAVPLDPPPSSAGPARLGAGAIAGVILGSFAVMAATVAVVARAIAGSRGREPDKTAQLDYVDGDASGSDSGSSSADDGDDDNNGGTDESAELGRASPPRPRRQQQLQQQAAAPRWLSAQAPPHERPFAAPAAAFLSLPDGEAARRVSGGGGIAYASLTQRRISSTGGQGQQRQGGSSGGGGVGGVAAKGR